MKVIVGGGEEMIIGASKRPFDMADAYYDKVVFLMELLVDELEITTKPHGVKIPWWEYIKDDKAKSS